MAYNMDFKKGLYPDEKGYRDWNTADFRREMSIEGTVTKDFKYIAPSDFHKKLMKAGFLPLTHPIQFTDIKIRNDIEMSKNKMYFQPKEWNVQKLLYNYDCTYHLWYLDKKFMEKYIYALKLHIFCLETNHKVPDEKRFIKEQPKKPKDEI